MTVLRTSLCTVFFSVGSVAPATAATIMVPSEQATIQAAIDVAVSGDMIVVSTGTYSESIDFLGKSVHLRGSGPDTVIRGAGEGPVISFTSGETNAAVLEGFTVTGGAAALGGGIFVDGASPMVVRNVITENQARLGGSGIFVRDGAPLIYNNLVTYNTTSGGDPHAVQLSDSSPTIVNNTIVRNDSNGLYFSGSSAPVAMNNILARNGSRNSGAFRGRGICDFTGGSAAIIYNLFSRNRVAALFRGGRDWRKMRGFQAANPSDLAVFANEDGRVGFNGRPSRRPERSSYDDFLLGRRALRRSRAIDQGNPDTACNDVDASRNDVGFTGGPYAPGSSALPGVASCGSF